MHTDHTWGSKELLQQLRAKSKANTMDSSGIGHKSSPEKVMSSINLVQSTFVCDSCLAQCFSVRGGLRLGEKHGVSLMREKCSCL